MCGGVEGQRTRLLCLWSWKSNITNQPPCVFNRMLLLPQPTSPAQNRVNSSHYACYNEQLTHRPGRLGQAYCTRQYSAVPPLGTTARKTPSLKLRLGTLQHPICG